MEEVILLVVFLSSARSIHHILDSELLISVSQPLFGECIHFRFYEYIKLKNNSVDFSPQANCTDRTAAAGWRS
jgi:hypothetical protein